MNNSSCRFLILTFRRCCSTIDVLEYLQNLPRAFIAALHNVSARRAVMYFSEPRKHRTDHVLHSFFAGALRRGSRTRSCWRFPEYIPHHQLSCIFYRRHISRRHRLLLRNYPSCALAPFFCEPISDADTFNNRRSFANDSKQQKTE